jgi:HEAT repeat protein
MVMRRALAVSLSLAAVLPGCRAKEKPPEPGQLVLDLRSPDTEKSGHARLLLITLGEPAVPAVTELLRSGTPAERVAAVNVLWGMGERGRAAVPDLVVAMADPDPALRAASAMALENMGAVAEPAVPALAKALGDRVPSVRQAAVKALGAIGPAARAALPALTRALRRGSWPEAEEAVRRIRGLQPGTPIELDPDVPEAP